MQSYNIYSILDSYLSSRKKSELDISNIDFLLNGFKAFYKKPLNTTETQKLRLMLENIL